MLVYKTFDIFSNIFENVKWYMLYKKNSINRDFSDNDNIYLK